MRINVSQHNIYRHIIEFLTILVFCSITIFETYTWGKFILFGGCFLIYGIHTVVFSQKSIRFHIQEFHILFFLFLAFCFLSTLWALDRSKSVIMSRTLFRILVLYSLIYEAYISERDMGKLLHLIRLSSYIIAIYAILFYGLDNMMEASKAEDVRLNNAFSNVNTIGMLCALGLVIQADDWIYTKKFRLADLLAIPSVVVLASTQSRKALVFLAAGIFLDYLLKCRGDRNKLKSIGKFLIFVLVAIGCLMLLSRLEMFGGLAERMEGMIAMFTGKGKVDSSAHNRDLYIQKGIEWWTDSPIVGYGIACPSVLMARYLGRDTYLHNNYVELLVGVGVIGVCLYYSMHVWLLSRLWKYRYVNPRYANFGMLWLLLNLAMDYGMVSYSGKMNWFYLMTLFIIVRQLKQQGESENAEKIPESGN